MGKGSTPLANYFRYATAVMKISLFEMWSSRYRTRCWVFNSMFFFIHCVLFIILVSCAYMNF